MRVYAYGAKKSRTRFLGALDLFTTIDAELRPSRKSGFGMPTLGSAIVRNARLGLRDDLGKIALAAYVVELVTHVGPDGAGEGAGARDLFDLLTDTLDQLAKTSASSVLRRAFELRLLSAIGCQPELSGCVVCGCPLDEARTFLDLIRGGVLCSRHKEAAKEVGPRTLAWMRHVLSIDGRTRDDTDDPAEDSAEKAARRAGPYLDGFLSHHIDRPLRSMDMLRDCQID